MKKIMKIHNTETGEIIEREMTEEEISFLDKQAKEEKVMIEAQAAELAAKAAEKEALLARLGITADEAKLLLGGN